MGFNHPRAGNILAGGSDSDDGAIAASDDDGGAAQSRPKPDFQKTIIEDSDNNDLITEDEDDDIPLVQLGTDYLSDSKFEKINSWIQDSPFSKRLSDYSSRVKKSPTEAANSDEEVESLLKSDPEDGSPVPAWAAPLPPLSTSRSTFVGERSSKDMLSGLSRDERETNTTNKSSTLRSSELTSQPSRGQDLSSKDYIPRYDQEERSSVKSSNSGYTENSEKEKSNDDLIPSHELDAPQPLDASLNKTIDKLELLNVKTDQSVNKTRNESNLNKPKEDPIVISSDEDEEVIKEVTFVSKRKSPLKAKPTTNLIENSVNNAVRCWTEVQTKQLEELKTKSKQRRISSSSSSNSEELENFFSKVKSTTRKKAVVSSSDSDKNFIVPDNEFDSDEFDEIDDAPVLNLKDRILRKTTTASTDESQPRVGGATPVSRNPKSSKPGLKTGDWRTRDGSGDSSDSKSSSGFPTNIYQPKFYNQIPKPTSTVTQTPFVTPKISTSKKPGGRSKKPEPKSSNKKPDNCFTTPTNPASTLTFLSSLTMDTPIERCHPQALPYIKNFKKSKEELAKRLYQMYNAQCFDHALPDDMEITWNVRLTKTAGLCYSRRHKKFNVETRSSRIELSTKVIDRGDRLRDTLIHEMCHAASWIISGYRDGHGPLWRTWAEKAMKRFPELPVIDRCHSYQISTKYTYKCVQCGYSIGRHSKSLDTERKVCGHCHGRFELVVNTGGGATPSSGTRGEGGGAARTPRAPTGFAKFVQDNYKVYKQPGTKHAEVMKILSNKFSETKITK